MKKLLTATALVFSLMVLTSASGFAQHGTTKLGLGVVYGSEVESPGIQANATFRISPRIAIAPDFSFYFADDEEDSPAYIENFWAANLNGHLMFATDPDYHIYGIGGLNVTTLEYSSTDESESELGLNLGLGGELHLSGFSLFSEVKYVVSDFDQVVLGAGVRFPLN